MERTDLRGRRPELNGAQAVHHLLPGKRFREATFGTYRPHPAYPSQQQACHRARTFAEETVAKPGRVWGWGLRRAASGRGLYLDGGFGVGKTHLLAGAFHAASQKVGRSGEVAFVQFQELTSVVGQLGMFASTELFGRVKLLCIDEFELDDPGNMHLIGTFLSRCLHGGMNVMTTSNTPPNAMG